jgi:tetratricopeptide (TPR) repeat protein
VTGRGRASGSEVDPSLIEGALVALHAGDLRELVRDILPWLEEPAYGRLVNSLVDRAARGDSDWIPDGPAARDVASIASFAEAARRVGYADPATVDEYLRLGSNAFLGKDYRSAAEIFRSLLLPVGEVEIDLGQHELVDEVLTVDVAACAAQYVVSTYMTADPEQRAEVVRASIHDVDGIGYFWEPLSSMERVAVEPLAEFGDFLSGWRELIEEGTSTDGRDDWATNEDAWLREVVQRLEGIDGLARIARRAGRADDLRAWCAALAESGDWVAALAAYEEAAELAAPMGDLSAEFLDGAVLSAQELDHPDLADLHERAWRCAPSMLRLCRWLGSAEDRAAVGVRAEEALDACPKQARRQRAFLHVVLGNHEAAAELLASAPGLGWSDRDHPGHVVFWLFHRLLGGRHAEPSPVSQPGDMPRPAAPRPQEILETAGAGARMDSGARTAMLEAMRAAAEKRVAGVTREKRRRYYGHAAQLVAACDAIDPTSETTRWVDEIRTAYRRYPALRRQFEEHLGRA